MVSPMLVQPGSVFTMEEMDAFAASVWSLLYRQVRVAVQALPLSAHS